MILSLVQVLLVLPDYTFWRGRPQQPAIDGRWSHLCVSWCDARVLLSANCLLHGKGIFDDLLHFCDIVLGSNRLVFRDFLLSR